MAKMNMISRVVYSLVGITGVGSAVWAVTNLDKFLGMGGLSIAAFSIAVIGGVNWGIVAITGNRDKDLFGLLGL